MLQRLLLRALNHLLESAPWARERLRGHAGQLVELGSGALRVRFSIDGEGTFRNSGSGDAAAVLIELPPEAAVGVLLEPASLFSRARLSGSADLADALGFVFKNLRWDAESDLARVLGDIPARRFVMVASSLGAWLQDAARRAALGVSEFATQEVDLLPPRRTLEAFSSDVAGLRDDLARLEKRLARLRHSSR